jgi:hypothetical protein
MWDTIREAIKTNGGTIRFIVIVVVLVATTVITWRLLGAAAPDLFAAVARILGAGQG